MERQRPSHPMKRPIEVPAASVVALTALSALALAVVLALSLHGDRYFPRADDWGVVPLLTGNADVPSALWEQNNEHRLPLPLLWMWAALALGGGDFRWSCASNTVLAMGAAIALLAATRRARGQLLFTDIVIPLLVLNPGNNIHMWGFHAQFTSSMAILLVLLGFLLRPPDASVSLRGWIGFGAGMAALPLCGLNGLIPAILLALGLLAHPLPGRPRDARDDGARRALRLGSVAALGSTALVLVGYQLPEHVGAARSPGAVLLMTGRVLVSPLGTLPPLASWCALSLLAVSAAVGLRPGRRETAGDARRTWLLFLFSLACVGLAFSVGWGRSIRSWRDGMQGHFAALAVPLWCSVYLLQATAQDRASRVVRVLLAALVATAFVQQIPRAWASAEILRARAATLGAAIDAGASAEEIVDTHFDLMSNVDSEHMRAIVILGLRQLQAYGAERYARLGSAAR